MAQVAEKAVKTDKAESVEVLEVLARATKFYQKWEAFGKQVDAFNVEFRSLKSDIVHLLNAKEATDRLVKDAEIRLARAEREAQTRLQTVEQGHRTLVDRLSKKEIELAAKISEIEKRENATAAERHKYELLKDEYERKLAGLTRVEASVSRK